MNEKFPNPRAEKESGPEIAEFIELVDRFEAEYSLEELHAIVDLAPEDAPRHPVREPARAALEPIVEKLNDLKERADISPEKKEELRTRYTRLSRAVGFINKNKVHHDR